ncbi:hypothetical protein HHI36_002513 [Cryptolaemus montrouzieri]|uniref:Uncharacterized protein n=1 Tax=Cryptolaemus montrouzieri TaxID=559131 RepID=A0ABD2PBB1_9CUCU
MNIIVKINKNDGYYKEFSEPIKDRKDWDSFSSAFSKIQKDVNVELTNLINASSISLTEAEGDEESSDEEDDNKRKIFNCDMSNCKKIKNK